LKEEITTFRSHTEIEEDYFTCVEGLRLERNWTETQLLEKAGVDYHVFQRFKSGELCVDLNSMDRLARAFKVPVKQMLDYYPFTHTFEAPKTKKSFRRHLLMQIEALRIRAGICHEELSARLGSFAERKLATYIIGNEPLLAPEIEAIARAFGIDGQTLAQSWAKSLELPIPKSKALSEMHIAARRHCAKNGGAMSPPSPPSFLAVVRAKYSDRLPLTPPPLWSTLSFGKKHDLKYRNRLSRGYEMLVEAVHDKRTTKEIATHRGISAAGALQMMRDAACQWAKREGVDLSMDARLMPRKQDAKKIKEFYVALRAISEQAHDDTPLKIRKHQKARSQHAK
jgi:transcriptional regulator with XRE-family HTH domain